MARATGRGWHNRYLRAGIMLVALWFTHVTPAPGTTAITIITVTSVESTTPDYFHLSGNVRFKISGMQITSSNIP
jgi:hypothetical protein